MSLYGVDQITTSLWRLDPRRSRERDEELAKLAHLGDVLALDHLPELAEPYARFLADPAAATPLRDALLALRARHDAAVQHECELALLHWVHAAESRPSSRTREFAEALAERWPRLTRERIDYRALERWLRDGRTEGLRAASELAMRAQDMAHTTAPRTFERALDAAPVSIIALASAWTRLLCPSFTLGGAPRSTVPEGRPSFLLVREPILIGPQFALSIASRSWFEGPGDILSCWSETARPLGIGPDAWLVLELKGTDDDPARLVLTCAAPEDALARLASSFESAQPNGMPLLGELGIS